MVQALQSSRVLGDLPAHIGNHKSSFDTMTSMVTMHRNANPHVRNWETPGHLLKATGIAGLSYSHLLYITDTISNYRFLIDTGAEVSVLPATSAER